MRSIILALVSTIPAFACVTVEESPVREPLRERTPEAAAPAPTIDDPDGFELSALEARSLADGECGVFLFTPNPSPRFVFFSNDSRGFAEMTINGAPATFQRISTGGTPFAQSFSEQVFRDGVRGIEVALSLQPGDPMSGGHEIAGGAMRLTKIDGWSMVIPVSGAAACQTQSIDPIG
ncbi:MAG: hypothetical protein AAGJ32_09710 [Pseudomonadota bacterium]